MRTILLALSVMALLGAIVCVAGCNTTKGLGKDIESVGAGMKGSAERNGAD